MSNGRLSGLADRGSGDERPRELTARARAYAWGELSRHGNRLVLADETTWTPPDDEIVVRDRSYQEVRVRSWRELHPKLHGRGRRRDRDEPPIVRGTVNRVDVEHLPKPTGRADTTL